METKTMLASMLKENTGKHLLDSGGAYGRNWERNQLRGFDAEPRATYEAYVHNGELDLTVSLSTYHFLCDALDYDEEEDNKFQTWMDTREDTHWLLDMEEYPETLNELGNSRWKLKTTGIYGDGEPFSVNTYNGECMIDQTLQYEYFELGGEAFVLLQIHGGADVRGGYTRPRMFRSMEEQIFRVAEGQVYCENGHSWYTDDSWNWYAGHSGEYKDLKKYDAIEIEEIEEIKTGAICILERIAYCPVCGSELKV